MFIDDHLFPHGIHLLCCSMAVPDLDYSVWSWVGNSCLQCWGRVSCHIVLLGLVTVDFQRCSLIFALWISVWHAFSHSCLSSLQQLPQIKARLIVIELDEAKCIIQWFVVRWVVSSHSNDKMSEPETIQAVKNRFHCDVRPEISKPHLIAFKGEFRVRFHCWFKLEPTKLRENRAYQMTSMHLMSRTVPTHISYNGVYTDAV